MTGNRESSQPSLEIDRWQIPFILYRVGKPVAIALVEFGKSSLLDGLGVDVDIAGRQNAGTIVPGCVYDPEGLGMRVRSR